MPRREGVDALGLPIMPSRSRPGSSNAIYTQGGTTFAGSSSSLGHTSVRGPATSESNLAAFVAPGPSPGTGPVSATEAPHLSTAESFFGRMTLTAPDNMRRKKLEEREKKKQVRKRRAERGANAAASIANLQDIGTSHMPLQSVPANVVASGLTAAAEQATSTSKRRKRPTLPTRNNSGSNLQTYTLEQSRSRSPTRPLRSQSGQNGGQSSQLASRQASPERRHVRRRNRGGSDASAVESGIAAAPTYQQASESEGGPSVSNPQPTTQQLASLPTAAQRRRDIYADLDTLGLPGADESDLEDQPPPFPANATRPISPPVMPVDGQEWTEEMRRRQEEYEMNRPPDSPPPAFRSEDERRTREQSEQLSSSDEESIAEEIARERQEWEEDVAAGFSLEERIERDRLRREAKDGPVSDTIAVADIPAESHISEVDEIMLEVNDVPEEIIENVEVLPMEVTEQQVVLEEQQASQPIKAEQSQGRQDVLGSPQNPLNLGKLVMEARARRDSDGPRVGSAVTASHSSAAVVQSNASLPILGASLPLQSGTSRLLQGSSSQPLQRAASQPSQDVTDLPVKVPTSFQITDSPQRLESSTSTVNHRRVASEGNAEQSTPTSTVAIPAKNIVLTRSSTPIANETKKASHQENKSTRPIKMRPRPSGESHSRFRDGASAAANRRMTLWGPSIIASDSAAVQNEQSILSGDTIPIGHDVDEIQLDKATVSPSLLQQQGSSSGKSTVTSAQESDSEDSSDSDGKWEKEDAAFQALQSRLAPPLVAEDESSEEEENASNRRSDQRPGWFRSNSMDLAKPGSSVPRAPPPLVLGRSRGGGAEYSSSSDSSSESGVNHIDDDSDDSLSPVEVEELNSKGKPSYSSSDRPLDKGKQPLRPSTVEADRTAKASVSNVPARAGEFEEDSGSSHDFASDDGEQGHREATNMGGFMRPPVGNRLKTLFSVPLGNSSQASTLAPSPASRASIGNLFDKQIDDTPSLTSKKSAQSFSQAEERTSLYKQPSDNSSRAKEWANAYAILESRQQQDSNSEQQIRLEALEQISRLQLASTASNANSSINHDSLEALEKLLSRQSYVPSFSGSGQPDEDRRANLRRSGAINRSNNAAPFVNPRSSIAPRPFGRLPTITNATRHFPPSRQATEEPANTFPPNPSFSAITPRDLRSVMDSGNWMTYIPESEKRGLPEPLEPVKKSREISPHRSPPPLPIRSTNSRVSAMIERFEGQGGESGSPIISSRSPSKDHFAVVMSPTEGITRETSLRRRPPPPPPPSARQQISRPISATITSVPLPTSPFLPSSNSQSEGLSSPQVKPFKPPFLEEYRSSHTPDQSNSLLSQTTPLSFQRESPPTEQQPVLPPRTRARPLPIPPIFNPTANTNTSAMQQISQLQTNFQEEEREESSSHDGVEESESPPPARSSSSSIPAVTRVPTREASLGYTDLDLFASRLADEGPTDGTNYEDLHLIAEFLGPAKPTGATTEEVEALSVGVVEVLRKRVVGKRENGKDKIKVSLQLMGIKVERCGVCLLQFKEGNLACLFPCLHVLHEDCATKLLRNTKLCPTCRVSI